MAELDNGTVETEVQTAPQPQPEDFYNEDAPAQQAEAEEVQEEVDPLEADYEGVEIDDAQPAAEEEIELPHGWTKEHAEAWKALPPEVQKVVTEREADRNKHLRRVSSESAEHRKTFETMALRAISENANHYAQQLQVYAEQFTPVAPDPRLLYSNNPDEVNLYHRQVAARDAALAQQTSLQQKVAQSQQQASDAAKRALEIENTQELERLREALPEFFDPDAGPSLQQTLNSVGQDLGYSVELMAQAGANDILALKKAAEWRSKAMKFDKIMQNRMNRVRSGKQPPRIARPGSAPTGRVEVDPIKLLYPND